MTLDKHRRKTCNPWPRRHGMLGASTPHIGLYRKIVLPEYYGPKVATETPHERVSWDPAEIWDIRCPNGHGENAQADAQWPRVYPLHA